MADLTRDQRIEELATENDRYELEWMAREMVAPLLDTVIPHGRPVPEVVAQWAENATEDSDSAWDLAELIVDGPEAIRDRIQDYAHVWAVNDADAVITGCGCPLDGCD